MRNEKTEPFDQTDSCVKCQTSPNELRVVFGSSPMGVREALRSTLQGLRHLNLTDDATSRVELVLAEVMNNIVEHAYSDGAEGMIELHVTYDKNVLKCVALDDGRSLPGGVMPDPAPPSPAPRLADEKESGFGWYLIRELSNELVYARVDDRNRLSFRLDLTRSVQNR